MGEACHLSEYEGGVEKCLYFEKLNRIYLRIPSQNSAEALNSRGTTEEVHARSG